MKYLSTVTGYSLEGGITRDFINHEVDAWVEAHPDCLEEEPEMVATEIMDEWKPD